MPNKNRNKKNQPPTGQGKKQSPRSGTANKLNKRSEVLQAAGAEQNIGTAEKKLREVLGTAQTQSDQKPDDNGVRSQCCPHLPSNLLERDILPEMLAAGNSYCYETQS